MVAIAYGRASDAPKATVCVAANTRTVSRAASRADQGPSQPIEQERGHTGRDERRQAQDHLRTPADDASPHQTIR